MFILISMKDIYSRERAFLYAQMDFGVSRIQTVSYTHLLDETKGEARKHG